MYDTKIQAFLKGLGHVPEARPAALDLYYTNAMGELKRKALPFIVRQVPLMLS
jgi:hypothetical protein